MKRKSLILILAVITLLFIPTLVSAAAVRDSGGVFNFLGDMVRNLIQQIAWINDAMFYEQPVLVFAGVFIFFLMVYIAILYRLPIFNHGGQINTKMAIFAAVGLTIVTTFVSGTAIVKMFVSTMESVGKMFSVVFFAILVIMIVALMISSWHAGRSTTNEFAADASMAGVTAKQQKGLELQEEKNLLGTRAELEQARRDASPQGPLSRLRSKLNTGLNSEEVQQAISEAEGGVNHLNSLVRDAERKIENARKEEIDLTSRVRKAENYLKVHSTNPVGKVAGARIDSEIIYDLKVLHGQLSVLTDIRTKEDTLISEIKSIEPEISHLKSDLQTLRNAVRSRNTHALEAAMLDFEREETNITSRISTLETQLTALITEVNTNRGTISNLLDTLSRDFGWEAENSRHPPPGRRGLMARLRRGP